MKPNQTKRCERMGQSSLPRSLGSRDCGRELASLEVLEVDILWPRWVARIGVTRSTQACFLAADRQCTELPLLRLPRLVPEVVGCDPFVPRDLARVGWRGLAPLLPIGPHARPRLADSFFAPGSGARGIPRVARPAIRRVAAMRRKERGPRGANPGKCVKNDHPHV